jgi:hypothetical protein
VVNVFDFSDGFSTLIPSPTKQPPNKIMVQKGSLPHHIGIIQGDVGKTEMKIHETFMTS